MSEKYYLIVEVSGGLAKIHDNISEDNIMDVNEAVDKLNELTQENKEIKRKYRICKYHRMNDANTIYCLEKENKELKDKLFEAEKDYLIETSDISDKLYLDEEIKKLKKEVYKEYH